MRCMALTILCCLAIGPYAAAVDKPPEDPKNQRSWLGNRLLSDMSQTDENMPETFATRDYGRVKAITNRSASPKFKISDDDVALLADYYYHTRARAADDLRQFQQQLVRLVQSQGQLPQPQLADTTDEETKTARADRKEISALGGKLADRADAVKSLSELIYASLPGFCLHETQMLPASYFAPDPTNGGLSYVGPVNNTVYAGPYAGSIGSYANADAARQAWLRHVLLWHMRNSQQNSATRQAGGRTGTGNMQGGTGANTTQNGTRSGNIRGWSGANTTQNRPWNGNGGKNTQVPVGSNTNQGGGTTGTGTTGRNGTSR